MGALTYTLYSIYFIHYIYMQWQLAQRCVQIEQTWFTYSNAMCSARKDINTDKDLLKRRFIAFIQTKLAKH